MVAKPRTVNAAGHAHATHRMSKTWLPVAIPHAAPRITSILGATLLLAESPVEGGHSVADVVRDWLRSRSATAQTEFLRRPLVAVRERPSENGGHLHRSEHR